MAIVYQHIRKDTGDIFYIGISNYEHRAYYKLRRNKYWQNISNKTDVEVQIVCKDITMDLAMDIEKYLIKYYGRFDLGLGKLVNMTDGGEGFSGYVITEEKRKKLSMAKKGRKMPDRVGEKNWMYGIKHTDEYKKKLSEILKIVKNTPENKEKVSKQFKGTKQSPEHIAKRMASMPKEFKKVSCPYCGVVGGGSNMIRYHFDKCKVSNKRIFNGELL